MLNKAYFEDRKDKVTAAIADYQAIADNQLEGLRDLPYWDKEAKQVQYDDSLRTLRWLQGRRDEIDQAIKEIEKLEEVQRVNN